MATFRLGMPGSCRVHRICYRRGIAKLSTRSWVLFTGKIGEFVLVYRIFLAAALVFWLIAPVASVLSRASIPVFLAFERVPVYLSHFQEPCNSQLLPIASRKREALRAQK